jgi:hypothetical protein
MKTEINVSFNYGFYLLEFSKTFNLDFAPFYNLIISDTKNDTDNNIELSNNDYCSTMIYYNTPFGEERFFSIDVRNHWKWPVTDQVIDETLYAFSETGWRRTDTTNIKELKELMNRDALRETKNL